MAAGGFGDRLRVLCRELGGGEQFSVDQRRPALVRDHLVDFHLPSST
jgi:hypothetical protein